MKHYRIHNETMEESIISSLIEPILENSGFLLVQLKKNIYEQVLQVFIEKVSGQLTITDCSKLTKEIIEILEKIRGPFNVNLIAQIAAAEILQNNRFLKKSIRHNFVWRNWLRKKLEKLNFKVYDSFGNFLLVKNTSTNISAKEIVSKLKDNNIIVRDLNNYGLKDFFRVSIGLESELKIFVKELYKIVE